MPALVPVAVAGEMEGQRSARGLEGGARVDDGQASCRDGRDRSAMDAIRILFRALEPEAAGYADRSDPEDAVESSPR